MPLFHVSVYHEKVEGRYRWSVGQPEVDAHIEWDRTQLSLMFELKRFEDAHCVGTPWRDQVNTNLCTGTHSFRSTEVKPVKLERSLPKPVGSS